MTKTIGLLCLVALSTHALSGCFYTPATRTDQGAVTGGAVGGAAGMILDRRNPWRGGIIGGIIGTIVGATLADVSERASSEAARNQRPTEYRTEDGRGVYRAEPLGYDGVTQCRRVQERVWQDGQLVRDRVREICTSDRNQPGY